MPRWQVIVALLALTAAAPGCSGDTEPVSAEKAHSTDPAREAETRLTGPCPVTLPGGDVPGGYGPSGFQPTGLTFPTAGCWRVTGSVGGASLTFVVRVVKRR
jgi:hypothetical protein